MRLIDADELKLDAQWDDYEDGFTAYSRIAIECAETVDAVPMSIIENIKAGIKCYIVDDDISGNTPNMLRISHAERNMAYKIVLNLIDRYIGHISGEEQK